MPNLRRISLYFKNGVYSLSKQINRRVKAIAMPIEKNTAIEMPGKISGHDKMPPKNPCHTNYATQKSLPTHYTHLKLGM